MFPIDTIKYYDNCVAFLGFKPLRCEGLKKFVSYRRLEDGSEIKDDLLEG